MANNKAAEKRILISERNRQRNVAVKSAVKTAVKKVLEVAQAGNAEEAQQKLNNAYSLYDKAVTKGVLHKNTAARKKSRLTRNVNKQLSAKAAE